MTGAFVYSSLLIVIVAAMFVVFLVIFIYKYFYKRNMNRALEGEATQGLFDPGQLFKTIMIIALVTLSIVSISKLNQLETLVLNQNNLISQLTQRIWALENNVDDLEEQMEGYIASQNLIVGSDYSVIDIEQTGEIKYFIEFTLLELSPGDQVKLLVKEGANETITGLGSTSLNFSSEVLLEDDHEYELYVLIEGSTLKQEHLMTIEVDNNFGGRFGASLGGSYSNGSYEFNIEVVNYYIGSENVKIDEVVYDLYINGILSDTNTVSVATHSGTEYEEFDTSFEFNGAENDVISFAITVTDNLGGTYSITIPS